jgi:hypothetical protein
MKSLAAGLGILGLGAVLAACNSSSNSTSPSPTCTIPVSQYQLVYPAPGATAVPDAIQQVIVAANTAFPSTWDATLGQVAGGTFAVVQPPFPSPTATPSFANPVFEESTFPNTVLPSQTTVSVYLNDLGSNCLPAGPIGSFTTQ